jgi:hypothetical protein
MLIISASYSWSLQYQQSRIIGFYDFSSVRLVKVWDKTSNKKIASYKVGRVGTFLCGKMAEA